MLQVETDSEGWPESDRWQAIAEKAVRAAILHSPDRRFLTEPVLVEVSVKFTSDEEVHALESVACPGPGACGGQYTANTMALVIDFLGISPRGLSGIPATHASKPQAAREAGVFTVGMFVAHKL